MTATEQVELTKHKVVVFMMLVQGTTFRFYRAQFTGRVGRQQHTHAPQLQR